MGVFSKWTLFEKPEKGLDKKLLSNPYHPFNEVILGGGHSNEQYQGFTQICTIVATELTMFFFSIYILQETV